MTTAHNLVAIFTLFLTHALLVASQIKIWLMRFHHSLPRTAIVLASRTNRRSWRRPISYQSSSGSLASSSSPGDSGVLDFCGKTMQAVTGQPIKTFIYLFIYFSFSRVSPGDQPQAKEPEPTLATRMVAGKKDRGTGDENDDMLLIDCFLILFTDFSIFQRFNVEGTRG